MTSTDDLIRNNDAYAADFELPDLAVAPARRVAIVTCMDARLDPARALGLREGDAHVIRNAGGVVTDDTIRSLAISQHLLGTEEIIVLHHTRCGMLTFTDDQFAEQLERASGQRPDWAPRAFSDLEEDLNDSVQRIRESPFIANADAVRGFIYEVESGRVREMI